MIELHLSERTHLEQFTEWVWQTHVDEPRSCLLRDKMLARELYNPMDAELVAARTRARDLCFDLNATREAAQDDRRARNSYFAAIPRSTRPPCASLVK